MKEPAIFRQGLIAGGDFGEIDLAIAPGDNVSSPGDPDGQFVVLALDLANCQDIKQLGMQRSAIKLENQIAHPRSERIDTHEIAPGLYGAATQKTDATPKSSP
jgi:hypothetical protein